MPDPTQNAKHPDTRTTIIEVASRLLHDGGPAAVTTRGVAQAAGVQAPTIYRLFGDKEGLLEALTEHVMAEFVSAKSAVVEAASKDGVDPLDDLRAGWQTMIDFGTANPDLFRLLSDPSRVVRSPAAQSGRQVLQARVRRVALAGRLRVAEARAVDLIQSAGTGTIQTLLATTPAQRDAGLADAMYGAVLREILTDAPPPSGAAPLPTVVAFRAAASQLDMLSDSERRLLAEWLDRVVDGLSA